MNRLPENEIYAYLGLARKGGNLAVGREAVRETLRHRSAALIVMSRDAGLALVRLMTRSGREAEVPLLVCGSKVDLGNALGRGETAVVAVTDAGLADAVLRIGGTPGSAVADRGSAGEVAHRTRRNA